MILKSQITLIWNSQIIGRFAIIGKSGSGKTTLLNIIASIINIDNGEIIKQNIDKISYVFQEDILNPYITVKKNIMLIKGAEENKVDNILKDLEIFELKDKYIDELSRRRKKKSVDCYGICF